MGNGLLHLSAINGHLEIAQRLIEMGLDPNAPGKEGNTPLHFASKGQHEELVIWLVEEAKCDTNKLNDRNQKAYDMTDHFAIRKYLLICMFPKKKLESGQKVGLGGVPLESPKNKGKGVMVLITRVLSCNSPSHCRY